MIGWTLCSGIGAPEIAAPEIDWRLASEIEAAPRAVLSHRFGHSYEPGARRRLWGDLTTLSTAAAAAESIPLPDVVVAGTPCQAFSVAGARKGLGDPRGNLTLAFVELCHAVRSVRGGRGLVVLWENVPGVLSDEGNAFGAFLGGLVGADAPLVPSPPPRRRGRRRAGWRWVGRKRWRAAGRRRYRKPRAVPVWPGVGMVAGPLGRAAWRILDAQHFGVAQRRRRVFVVCDLGAGADPAAILFERRGLQGDPAARGQEREDASGPSQDGARGGGAAVGHHGEIAGTVRAKWSKGTGGPAGDETQNLVAFDTTQVTSAGNYSVPKAGGSFHQLAAGAHPPAVAFSVRGRGEGAVPEVERGGVAPAVRAASGGSSRGMVALGFNARQDQDPWPERTGPLDTDGATQAVAAPVAVRRLTPRECERLQGFPDDHTAVPYRGGAVMADGPRYKCLGNSMAVPVVGWILRRVVADFEARERARGGEAAA